MGPWFSASHVTNAFIKLSLSQYHTVTEEHMAFYHYRGLWQDIEIAGRRWLTRPGTVSPQQQQDHQQQQQHQLHLGFWRACHSLPLCNSKTAPPHSVPCAPGFYPQILTRDLKKTWLRWRKREDPRKTRGAENQLTPLRGKLTQRWR